MDPKRSHSKVRQEEEEQKREQKVAPGHSGQPGQVGSGVSIEGEGVGRARGRTSRKLKDDVMRPARTGMEPSPGDGGALSKQPGPHSRPVSQPSQLVQPGLGGSGVGAEGEGMGRARGRSTKMTKETGRLPRGGMGEEGAYRGREATGGASNVQGMVEAMGAMKLHMMEEGDNNGSGSGSASVGRGTLRGKREIRNIVWTKPTTVTVKKGTIGQVVPLFSNYFQLNSTREISTCVYHVYFSPEEDRTPVKKKLLAQHRANLGSYIFDGAMLYMGHKLPSKETELVSILEQGGEVYQLRVVFIKEVNFLEPEYMQIMNVLLRRCLEHLNLQLVGRNYYNPSAEIRDDKYRIAIWPGYVTSLRQHEEVVMLGADVSHKFLRIDTAYNMMQKRGPNPQEAALSSLLGSVVVTKYNNKTYRIDDIAWDLNPLCKFPFQGKEITYIEYYEKKYQVKIRDVRQPLLLSKPKKRDLRRGAGNIYLIPELCIMTGLTEDMRNDFNMMRDLADYLRTSPDKRVHALMSLNKGLFTNEKVKQELNDWGLQLSNKLVELHGRVLPKESILQGGQSVVYNGETAEWSKEIRSLRLNVPVCLNQWAMVFPGRIRDGARELCNFLQRVGPPMGMQFNNPVIYGLQSDRIQECVASLDRCRDMQLVLVVLPSSRADYYAAVKRHLTTKMGMPSQCVTSRTLSKRQRLMSVATKIAIQINCKLGGEPWTVAIPVKNTMVIGYDSYTEKGPHKASYGAVVSSLNPGLSRYLSQAATHKNFEELSDNFTLGIKNALQKYRQENGAMPRRVLIYRDGVGEGQLEQVRDHEIASIQRCFSEMFETKPEFAFIVVSKRINTRLFSRSRGRIANPPPGTVADDVITLPERYDFFLVPQSTNVGTVSPTCFNIVADTTGLKPDHMQRLAFKLTHLYYNWQGTIRVPAPCMFAHKLAFMMGQVINKQPHPNLLTSLWYL